MKKIIAAISLCLVLLLWGCGSQSDQPATSTPTLAPSATLGAEGQEQSNPPEGEVTPTPTPAAVVPSAPTSEPTDAPTVAPTATRSLYDPSIFVIEASGTWQTELAPGYYANNECELYLHKIDANDNRAVAGSYQGVFWMKTTLDAGEFIDDMLGDAPVDVSFDAGAEAVADNLALSLNTTDDKAWTDYSIPGEDGNPLPLSRDMPVGKGSFVAVAKNVYLEAHASGVQGESVDYSDAGEEDLVDVNYVIHVQPDAAESGGQREVIIELSGEGFCVTLNGVLRRLSGYPEDVSDYLNSSDYQDSAWRHLQ